MEQQKMHPHLEPRVQSLETEVIHLNKAITSLANTLDRSHKDLSDKIQRMAEDNNKALMSISDKMSSNFKTQWGPLASWASIIIVVGSIVCGVLYKDIIRVHIDQQKDHETITELRLEAARADERFKALKEYSKTGQ